MFFYLSALKIWAAGCCHQLPARDESMRPGAGAQASASCQALYNKTCFVLWR